ncbi:MAG: hypothetical protein ABIB47_02745 [Candidatus Woesearchaeota archaeon]
MKKRGQTAAFVILGIVIVVVVVVLVYLAGTRTRTAQTEVSATQGDIDNAIKEVNELVETCFEKVARSAIKSAGTYGGFASKSARPGDPGNCFPPNLDGERFGIPFLSRGPDVFRVAYIYGCDDHLRTGGPPYCQEILFGLRDGDNLGPIQNCMEKYFENSFETCVKNFNNLESRGWEIEENEDLLLLSGETITTFGGKRYRVEVKIESDRGILFTLQIPRTFSKGDQSFSINEFNYENSADFYKILTVFADELRNRAISGGALNPNYLSRKSEYGNYGASPDMDGYELESGASIFGADYFLINDTDNEDVEFQFGFWFKRFECAPGETPGDDGCCSFVEVNTTDNCISLIEWQTLEQMVVDFYGL